MNIKIGLTEDEENMILSAEEAERQGIERNHIAMTKALSKIIEESDLDAETFSRLKMRYKFLGARNRKIHVYRCRPQCVNVVYRMRLAFHCSEEMVIYGILYHHLEKCTGEKDDYSVADLE